MFGSTLVHVLKLAERVEVVVVSKLTLVACPLDTIGKRHTRIAAVTHERLIKDLNM
jgi:hypothetical protein